MTISVFILGSIGMTAQAVFLREILATFRAGELTIGAALFFWLLWTSVGSGVLGRLVSRLGNPDKWFHTILPWYGVCGYLGVSVIGSVPFLVRLTPGELIPYDFQCITVALAFLPFNVLGGFLFTLGVKALERKDSPSAGKTYTLEALGSALAGAVVSLILVSITTNKAIALTCPIIGIITAFLRGYIRKTSRYIYLLALPVVSLLVITWLNQSASRYYYRGQTLLCEKETKYGRLRVTEQGEQITFYSDASTLFSAPDPETSEYLVHIPMLASDEPRNILVLGGGPGGVIDEVLKYETVEWVACVELDPGLFELAELYLEEAWKDDPRVETVFTDGRAFLENTERKFDVIIMNMPAPLSGVTNRYYTGEFFSLVSSRLTKRGILGFSLTGSENYIPEDLAWFLASIRHTLRSAFPSVTALPGLECRFAAGNSPGLVDSLSWEYFVAKRKKLGIETSYIRDYFLRFTMAPERMKFLTENLDAVQSPSINSDTKPTGYFSRTIVQGNLDASRVIHFINIFANHGILLALVIIGITSAALFAFLPGKGALTRNVMATVLSVGLTEISLEVLAIMAYQSLFGFLYGRIALLTGSYMAGLAAGALVGTRMVEQGRAGTKLLASIQASIAVIPLVWVFMLWTPTAFPGRKPLLEAGFYILTAFAGIAGGVQFPIADSLYRVSLHRRHTGLGSIYAVDLAGSSVGALVTASLLIPILGMAHVLVALAVLNAITASIMWLRKSET
ncbi:fused MFS/spermidine synthase [Candidatus Latescibacterota bacterium]